MSGTSTPRARALLILPALGLAAACAVEGVKPREPTRSAPRTRAQTDAPVPPLGTEYVMGDPPLRGTSGFLPLHADGGLGIAIDKMRVVLRGRSVSVAPEVTVDALEGATRIPERLGGGFLFFTSRALYRAATFDGSLTPVAKLRDRISSLSFGPRAVLVRCHGGERVALALPSGDRAPIDPVGLADVEALDDGRALAFTDRGALMASVDGGGHWNDVTSQLRATPERVHVFDGELWVVDSAGAGLRLERGGGLTWFDKAPQQKPVELRPKDARWRSSEAPLRLAFRAGAAMDERVALVIEGGDLFRVDVRTGEIAGVVRGRLPPDATCEGVSAQGDVVFVCSARSSSAGAFVVSKTIAGDPVVEHTFVDNPAIYASDDGGLAADGPCTSTARTNAGPVVCVRQPGGAWIELEVSTSAPDAGAGGGPMEVVRWIPRADGSVVGLVAEGTPGLVDPRSGSFVSIDGGDVLGSTGVRRRRVFPGMRRRGVVQIDRAWSFVTGGALRGWLTGGGAVEIGPDGSLKRSPFTFDVIPAGPFALGKAPEGRLYQTSDHGATWSEIAPPPGGVTQIEGCTTAGCDLGAFYRVGWPSRPPRPEAARAFAPPVPEVRAEPPLALTCRPLGPVALKALKRTDASPEDLGLGDARIAAPPGRDLSDPYRHTLGVEMVSPVHDVPTPSGETALRAVVTGGPVSLDHAPDRATLAARRVVSWVPPFDPAAVVRRPSFTVADALSAGRASGVPLEELLSDDLITLERALHVTPTDPAASGDLAVHNGAGLLVLLRGDRARVSLRKTPNDAIVTSGVSLSADETAFLEVEPSTGSSRVFKATPNGLVDLFDLPSQLSDSAYYPANPDALAIGPKGDLAVVRTPSGSEPASDRDPAMLVTSSGQRVKLAPWSTARFATEPECRADTQGYRATLQLVAPWVRPSDPDLRQEASQSYVRVRWSPTRVCIEGFETRVAGVQARVGGDTLDLDTWIIGRASGPRPSFARVVIGEGVERRQPMECAPVK